MLNITDKKVEEKIPAWLRLGFRPFFLLGSVYGIFAVMAWVIMFQKGQPEALQVSALWWHAHEMIFGFAMAIVVGFVLTAVQTWTGVNGTKHYRLLLLVALWELTRILFWMPVPLWLTSSIESLFILLAAYEVGFRVYQSKGWKNLFFVPLFLLAIFANLASYATVKGMPPFSSSAVWDAMIWWFTILISVMGGRVIPFFSSCRFQFDKPQSLIWLEWLATLPLMGLFVLSFFPLSFAVLGKPLMLIAGLFQLVRWLRWKPWITLSEPLVWSLMLTYLCLPLSLLYRGMLTDAFASHAMLHLFALGALGGLVLSMISRVTMGHTGRAIYKGPNMTWAFVAIIVAAVLRSICVAVWPQHMFLMIDISAGLWVFAFGMYVYHFGNMLITKKRRKASPFRAVI